MATGKRVFTLRLRDDVFDKIGLLATKEHRSMTNYIEHVLLEHLKKYEQDHGEVTLDYAQENEQSKKSSPVVE